MTDQLSAVRDFWNAESCGERYATAGDEALAYRQETENRYRVEPYILEFADFSQFAGKDVLEIGVGMGSDHSQIALSGPASLTGVDLTERAIGHTTRRFESLGLKSQLRTANAEALPFADESFDAVYSWGVLHHSPDTPRCFEEVWRVLRPGGVAKIVIYHKHAPTGWMLWARYGLMRGRPFTPLAKIYADHLESPGTKAYTLKEARELTKRFSHAHCEARLSFGDLLEGDVGARHRGPMLSAAKALYPRWAMRALSRVFPIGLCLLITARK